MLEQSLNKMGDFGNLLLNTDCYKHSHYIQYPPGTEYISSYIEARGGPFPAVVHMGLQAYIMEYLMKPITLADLDEAELVCEWHEIPFYREGWMGVLEDYDGYLPVEIEAVPEGTVMPIRNVMAQIVNTDPKYFWVTSFIETAFLRGVWYPSTVCTLSWMCKQIIRQALNESADDPDGIIRALLHDYGARGVSSQMSAAIGGMAHLVNFHQTDTMSGSLAALRYYGQPATGVSSPSAEHSTINAWGEAHEADAYRNLVEAYDGFPYIVVVSDSYNLENAIKNIWGKELKSLVENGKSPVFVRPDSGHPPTVVADSIEWLMDAYGHNVNTKGYKVLPSCVRICQGDGINILSLKDIYKEMHKRKISSENVGFGMGGGLLQQVNRDSMHFAMKCSAAKVNGEWRDVNKKPSESGLKASKAGRLALVRENGDYKTVPRDSVPESENVLKTVFRNGKLLKRHRFDEVIARSEAEVPDYYWEPIMSDDFDADFTSNAY